MPGPLTQLLAANRPPLDVVDHLVESDEEFLARAASGAVFRDNWSNPTDEPQDALDIVLSQGVSGPKHTAFGGPGARIRLIGGDALALEEALGASIDVAIFDAPVVEAGLIEMLPFLREQSVSVTAHRFGDVDPRFAALRVDLPGPRPSGRTASWPILVLVSLGRHDDPVGGTRVPPTGSVRSVNEDRSVLGVAPVLGLDAGLVHAVAQVVGHRRGTLACRGRGRPARSGRTASRGSSRPLRRP